MSIYSRLIDKGYTREQIFGDRARRASTRGFTVVAVETPDGEPIVGITYACDFRSEEERGVSDIRKALVGPRADTHEYVMSPKSDVRIGRFEGLHSLIISVDPLGGDDDYGTFEWGRNILNDNKREGGWNRLASGSKDAEKRSQWSDYEYDVWWENAVSGEQGIAQDYKLNWESIADLRARAYGLGVSLKGLRKKADILSAIKTSPEFLASAETPDNWPGWFHMGSQLILRADRGIAADVLDDLYIAGKHGTLAQGGGDAIFGSGMSFYDGMDVGPKLIKERKAAAKWYDKAMKNLAPVRKALEAKGHYFYFLGNPKPNVSGKTETAYWINASGSGLSRYSSATTPRYPQAFGWYTLAELKAEKFMNDSIAKADKDKINK